MAKETGNWHHHLSSKSFSRSSSVGVAWPVGADDKDYSKMPEVNIEGKTFYPNCYPVEWIENHWSPKLNEAMKRHSL